jgi:hypothetical protein
MEYRIKVDGFKEIQKRIVLKQIPFTLFTLTIAIYIYYSYLTKIEIGINILPFIIIVVILYLGYGSFKRIKFQKTVFESFRLIILEDSITREQQLLGTKTIPKNQISSISKQKNADLTIIGANQLGFINIPAQIENYTEIEQILNQIQPIMNIEKENLWVKYASYFNYLIFILFIGVFFLKNKIIVALSGSILIFFLMVSFIYVMKSKLIDKKTKKLFWGVFILILGIMGAMYTKLV